jgi:hypothetical protein
MGKAGLGETVLQRFLTKANLKDLAASGKSRAVIDHSDWYHASVYKCAVDVFEQNEKAAIDTMWRAYMDRLTVLQLGGVTVAHFVFDGASVPAKAPTTNKRQTDRAAAALEAKACRATWHGNPTPTQKKEYTKKCNAAVGREPWLENALFNKLLEWNVASPKMKVTRAKALGEADPQIIHLLNLKHYDFAIVNDWDYALYGFCHVFMYKLFYRSHHWKAYQPGDGDVLDLTSWKGKLGRCGLPGCTADQKNCSTCGAAIGLTKLGLTQACILAGTDYHPTGLKKVMCLCVRACVCVCVES